MSLRRDRPRRHVIDNRVHEPELPVARDRLSVFAARLSQTWLWVAIGLVTIVGLSV